MSASSTYATRAEARARLAEIDDAIADIRTQIATADMKRQEGSRVDPDWVHRARTALRHLRRERAEVSAALAALPDPKAALKDRIIGIVRAEYDKAGWARVMDRARAEAE